MKFSIKSSSQPRSYTHQTSFSNLNFKQLFWPWSNEIFELCSDLLERIHHYQKQGSS